MKVILYQPQIPQNTGNIARTCAVTGTELILVRPLGFSTASRHLKRAGLDYWNDLSVLEIDDLSDFLEKTNDPFCFFSSKATAFYTSAEYRPNHLLIFGSETAGLPESVHHRWPDRFYRIPMQKKARCLNLSCSVSIALYEAYRQTNWFMPNETTCSVKETKPC
jgi:tRNA (cytidine/uridine-2'-O-)-methyltransferase